MIAKTNKSPKKLKKFDKKLKRTFPVKNLE